MDNNGGARLEGCLKVVSARIKLSGNRIEVKEGYIQEIV